MAYDFQVVVDAVDPHSQADWWAQTLGWAVEPSDEAFIRRMVEQGHATQAETKLHHGVLVWATGQAIRPPDGGRRVLFQASAESAPDQPPARRHNRLHLDVRVGDEQRADVVASLVARGATKLWDGRQGPYSWVTLIDPEGNEFCVA